MATASVVGRGLREERLGGRPARFPDWRAMGGWADPSLYGESPGCACRLAFLAARFLESRIRVDAARLAGKTPEDDPLADPEPDEDDVASEDEDDDGEEEAEEDDQDKET